MLKAGCAAAATLVGGSALSQQVPGPKGPRIWLDLDQKELDDAYDQRVWAPNQPHITKRRDSASERARARLGPPERVAYGPTEIERLDIYKTTRPNAPIHVFIHGGAWRGGLARDYAYPAEMFVAAGAHYVVPDFAWVQNVGGSLMPIADQLRRAVAWVYTHAARFGADASRLYLSGHSSGGHMAGVVLVTDWQKDFGLPADIVKGGLLISGMYDLKAPRLSARANYVKFDDAMEHALSSQRHLDKLGTPVIVAYGTQESPEFQRQSRDFAAAVKAAGKPVQLIVGEGYNHFELPETLGNPYGLMGRAALDQMKLVARSAS